MKHKILFLLTALLCSFTTAYGQTITTLADANPNKCYYITSQSGRLSCNGTAIQRVATNNTGDGCRFAFVKSIFGNDYYLYSVAAKKFVTSNLALSETPGVPVTLTSFKNGNNTYYNVTIGSSGNRNLKITGSAVSLNNGIQNNLLNRGYYNHTITEVADFDPAEARMRFTENKSIFINVNPQNHGGNGNVYSFYTDNNGIRGNNRGSSTAADYRFAFIKHSGNYYLYSVGQQKFVTLDENNNCKLTEKPDMASNAIFEATDNANYPWVINLGDRTHLQASDYNIFNWYGWWTATDVNNQVKFEIADTNFDQSDAETLMSNPISDLSATSIFKSYTIRQEGHPYGMYAFDDKTTISSTNDWNEKFPRKSSDPHQQFAFIPYNGKYYLYSVSRKKFISTGSESILSPGTFSCIGVVDGVPDKYLTLRSTGNANFPAQIQVDGQNVQLNDWHGNIYSYQENHQIFEAEEFDPSEALLKLSGLEGKCFTIETERGTTNWLAPSNNTGEAVNVTQYVDGVSNNSADTRQQFAFAHNATNGALFLYHVNSGKYLTVDGSGTIRLSDNPISSVRLGPSAESATYPFIIGLNSKQFVAHNYGWRFATWGVNYEDYGVRTDQGCRVNITPIRDLNSSEEKDVSGYKVVDYTVIYAGDGSTVYNRQGVAAQKGAAQLPPDFTDNGLMTYTFAPSTLDDATKKVTVTATWNGPFEISANYASAKWYFLKLKGSHFVTYTSGTTPNVASPTTNAITEGTQWAFIGNPYTGLTIVNQAAGSSNKLVSDDPYNDGNTGGNTYATVQTSGSKDVWIPSKSTYLDGGFFLRNVDGYYLNHRSDANLAYWTSWYDLGSTFQVESIDDMLDELEPWFTQHIGQYFALSQEAFDNLNPTYQTYHSNGCTLAQFRELKTGVTNGTRKPATGYYRIKTLGIRDGGTPTYITCPDGNKLSTVTTAGTAGTVVKLTGTYPNYTLQIQDRYCKWFDWAYSVPALVSTDANDAGSLTFSIYSPGIVSILNQASSLFFHEDASHNVVAWTDASDNDASKWMVEDATSTSLTLNAAKDLSGHNRAYATAYLPFDVTLPDGVTAYALTSPHPRNAGDETLIINPTDIGREVPAGTPVLIASATAGAVTATIGTVSATAPETNILQGNYFPETSTGNSHLVLNKNAAGNVGFFNLKSGSTLAANRAYIPYSLATSNTSSARDICIFWDFNFDDEATIEDVTKLINLLLSQDKDGNANLAPSILQGMKFTDVNGDGKVTIADVTKLVNMVLGK